LAAASGCDIVPKEGDEGGPSGDKPIDPGSMQRPPGDGVYPGGPGPSPGGTPVVRKLALNLSGVAGFAILDPEADSTGSTTGTPSSDVPAPPPGASAMPGSGSNVMWLGTSPVGQELRARRTIDTNAVRQTIVGKRGMGETPSNVASRQLAAQQDPGTPGAAGAGAPGAAPPALPGTESGEASSAGEQAGLLKITQEGQVEPALVALEETPIEQPPSADAGVPPSPPPAEPGNPGTGGSSGTSQPAPGVPSTGAGGVTSGSGSAPAPGVPMPPMQHLEPLPRVTAVGLSPDGNVYILFERSFMYRQPSAEDMASGVDLYGPSSPYRCQLFRANGSWQVAAAELAELECVTNQHEVRTWDARRVMQFDASGKLYFRAAVPGQPKEVFYQYNPTTRALSEKVNGNICWRDVQVTPRGSLFYTGSSTSSDGGCGGTSFFRYVSADNRLTEIARNWWNFKYLAEQDPEDPNNERIIFYGPDPNATSSVGWDTACLYRYDPAVAEPAARTERLVECSSNPFNYVYGSSAMPGQVSDADLAAFGARCASEGQLFVGGEGVTGLSQLRDGTLFVVGKFQKKLAGEVHCGLDVNVDHCDSADPAHATEEACTGAGHQWLHVQSSCSKPEYLDPGSCAANEGVWTNGVGPRHYDAAGASCLTPQPGFTRGFLDCRSPGQSQPGPQPMPSLTQEVNGLAYLAPREGGGFELRLVSDPSEKVERYWAIEGQNGPELYYSVYSAGQYNLRLATQVEAGEGQVEIARRALLDDFEVYNLQRDPGNSSRVMFDALQFATNEYLFGSADTTLPSPEEVLASVQAVQGVSGRVETLIVLPNL
jgi:hypothetical protein